MVNIAGQKAYVMNNITGNVIALYSTDGNNTVLGQYEYSPYGDIMKISGTLAEQNPLRYSSRYHDDTLSLHYYGHRHYSPRHMRWLSKDPMGEQYGLNLYQFVLNNPVNYWDRLGLSAEGSGGIAFTWPSFTKILSKLNNTCTLAEGAAIAILTANGGIKAAYAFTLYTSGIVSEWELSKEEAEDLYSNSDIWNVSDRDSLADYSYNCSQNKATASNSFTHIYEAKKKSPWKWITYHYTGTLNVSCKKCVFSKDSFKLDDFYDFTPANHDDKKTVITYGGYFIGTIGISCGWQPYKITGKFDFK